MSYRGKTYQLPFDKGGLNHNNNIDLIPPEYMVYPSRNVNLHKGGREKRGGSSHVNGSAISGTPRTWGIYQFRLQNGNTFILTATSDGKIQKDYATELKTGLTINAPVYFETYNNMCFICTGNDTPQIWDGAAASTTDITNPAADWATLGQPKIMINHSRQNSNRLFAFGCSQRPGTVYYPDANSHDGSTEPDYTAGTSGTVQMETYGYPLHSAVEYGNRLIFQTLIQNYILDDSSTTLSNWGYQQTQWNGGSGSQRLMIKTPYDLIAMAEDGVIYSVLTAEQYGDYKSGSLTKYSFIHEWIQEHVELSAIADFHMTYDPALKAVFIFVTRSGMSYNDTALVYFIDRESKEAWMVHDNQSYDSGYKASCSALVRVGAGDWKIYTGGWSDGFVWKLNQINKNDNSQGYYAGIKTARLTFGNPRAHKRYDRARLITKPEGNYNMTVDWWIDGTQQTQRTVSLSGAGGILGLFVLGTSVLGGGELIDSTFELGNTGKRIEFEIYNSNPNEDFFVSQLLIDHKTLGAAAE